MMSGSALSVRSLDVAYEERRVLEGITLEVPAGAMVGIVGPNGGGKSTLIKALLGLVRPAGGGVEVFGRKLDRKVRRSIGYVPQREDVDWNFPVTVFDVVMMGRIPSLGFMRRHSQRDRELVREALETVGMVANADTQIGQLSGGQQQRVFLARALAQEAEILLLDEPVSGVDALAQHEVFDLLHTLQSRGKTILLTTHDLSIIAERFDSALLLNRRVIAYGKPDDVFTPELLNETYQSQLKLFRVGDRTIAVEERPVR